MTAPYRGSSSAYTRGQLRGRGHLRVMRDLYVPADLELTLKVRVKGALALFPGAVPCRQTSGLLLNLPVEDDGLIHLDRARTSEIPGIKVHRLGITSTYDLDGMPISDGPRTLADLSDVLDLEGLVAVGDVVSRRWGAEKIAKAVADHGRRRGAVLLRQAVPLFDKGSASPAETRCRLRLHAAGFTRMAHKVIVRDLAGEWLAELDLGDPVARVGLQHEGLIHFEKGAKQRRQDADRDELSRAEDWTIVSSFAQDDADPERLIRKVTAAYHQAARLHGPQVLPSCLR